MSEDPWFRFFPSDWLGGTRGMTAAEVGIYITLVAMMYDRGEPVPEDHKRLARVCGCTVGAFKKTLDILIDEDKIRRVSDGLWNKRAATEIEIRDEKSNLARQNANARWGKKTNKNNGGTHATAKPAQSHSNANQSPESKERDTNVSPKKDRRGARLPNDWQPSETDAEWCRKKYPGIGRQFVADETEKFRNYWHAKTGQAATKLDWSKTWQNWMMTAVDRKQSPRGSPVQRPKDALDHGYDLVKELEDASTRRFQPDQPAPRQLPAPESERDGS